jgi:hypothetical protein
VDYRGKVHLTFILKVDPEDVAEGDRLFASHGEWMTRTHHRDGEKALLAYNVSKGEDPSNPLDPNSAPTGKTVYVLDEIYASPAGLADHWQQGASSWSDNQAFVSWAQKCEFSAQHAGTVVNSLWR